MMLTPLPVDHEPKCIQTPSTAVCDARLYDYNITEMEIKDKI